MLKSQATAKFWSLFEALPADVRERAQKQFGIFQSDPLHPSLHLKPIGDYWSVRISSSYRALALKSADTFTWFWIGTHDQYKRMIG